MFLLFAVFITMYFSNELGYFEYQKSKQVTLTQEQILKFEQDIKDGKDISLEDYVVDVNKNYQTSLSKTGLNVSNLLSKSVKSGVENIFKALNGFVTGGA